jgi:hypothetical protein
VKLLRRVFAWWRGSADTALRAEATRIQDKLDLVRAETVFGAGRTTKAGG